MTLNRHFTNRDGETQLFLDSVEGGGPCLINFHGRPAELASLGCFATSTVNVRLLENPVVLLNLEHEDDCDFLRIVNHIRRNAPADWFASVAKAIDGGFARLQTVYVQGLPGGQGPAVDFGSGNAFTGSFSDVAIGGNVIKPTIVLPEYAQRQLLRQFEDEVTEAFVSSLLGCPKGSRVILLLDSFQLASAEMQKWLQRRVLARVAASETCALRVALCGHSEVVSAGECQCIVVNREVLPFDRESAVQYIRRRSALSVDQQDFLFRITKGHPQNLALAIDNLEEGNGL